MGVRERHKYTGGFDTELTNYEKLLDGTIIGTGHTYVGNLEHKYIRDQVTPGFRALQKCGKFLPLNGVSILREFEHRAPASWNVTNSTSTLMTGDYYYPEFGRTIDPPMPDPDKLDRQILGAKANAASSDFDVTTFLGELQESVHMIRGIAGAFNHGTKSLALEAAKWKNPWKRFSDLWNGYRFGVKPLMGDAQNALKALNNSVDKFNKGRSRTSEDLTVAKDTLHDFYGRFSVLVREKITGQRTYRGIAYCKTDFLSNGSLQSDPFVTAWELVPYSFVVDRFINIGNYISTIRPTLLGEYFGVGGSVQTEYSYRREVVLAAMTPPWTGTVSNCLTEVDVSEYNRMPQEASLPAPYLELTIPQIVDLGTLFLKGRADVYRILSKAFNGRGK
jgi:hypothetical protein